MASLPGEILGKRNGNSDDCQGFVTGRETCVVGCESSCCKSFDLPLHSAWHAARRINSAVGALAPWSRRTMESTRGARNADAT